MENKFIKQEKTVTPTEFISLNLFMGNHWKFMVEEYKFKKYRKEDKFKT